MLKHITDTEKLILTAYEVPDGLRHLRNFAKKRGKLDVLRSISEFISKKKPDEILTTGVQNDFSEVTEIFKQVYEAKNIKDRDLLLERATKSLQLNSKDQFYSKLVAESGQVTKKQIQVYKENGGKIQIIDQPLSTLVEYYVKQNSTKNDEEAKSLKNQLKIVEPYYFTWVIKASAENKNWDEVTKYVQMDK